MYTASQDNGAARVKDRWMLLLLRVLEVAVVQGRGRRAFDNLPGWHLL